MLARVSIVALVRGVLFMLGILLVAMSVASLVDATSRYTTANRVSQINAISDALLFATENLAVERGTTNTALQGAAPADQATRDAIETRRANADGALAEAFGGLDGHEFPDKERLVAGVEATLARVDDLRGQADTQLRQPRPRRSADLVDGWMPAIVALMDSVGALSTAVGFEIKLADPFVAEQTLVKELAWQARDFAGRERAAIGAALASGAGLSGQNQVTVAGFQGRVALAWQEIEKVAARQGAPREIVEQVAETRRVYFDTFRGQVEPVYAALASGGPAPMTGPEWYELSNPPLASIMHVKDASVAATSDHASARVAAAEFSIALNVAILALAALMLAGAMFLTNRRIARPVAGLTNAIEALADKRYDTAVPCLGNRDELGKMARALDALRERAETADGLQAERERTQEEQLRRSRRIEEVSRQFDANVTGALDLMARAAAGMEANADELLSTADTTSGRAAVVATASEELTVNVQTVASATEELSSSIAEINRQMVESLNISRQAVEEVDHTNATIEGLAASASQIGEIVELITNIAAQTNLLALNATIEAARAGEAGRGFAVVANEVKTLADQTAKATDEISSQIAGMQSVTGGAVEAIQRIGRTIVQVNEIVNSIAAAVEEQGVATSEIAANVQQAATGTNEVSSNIVEVTSGTRLTGQKSSEVHTASGEVNRQSDLLRREVAGFLEEVRSA